MGGENSRGVEDVLRPKRDPVKRAAEMTAGDLTLCHFRGLERLLAAYGDEGAQL